MSKTSPIRTAPLSHMQQQLWVWQQMNPESPAYNLVFCIHTNTSFDIAALQKSLNDLIRGHEILRTSFGYQDGQPIQLVNPPADNPIRVIDLQHVDENDRELEAKRIITAEAQRPMLLSSSSLLRAILIKLDAQKHQFHIIMHHTLMDGYSAYYMFFPELRARYDALVAGNVYTHPAPISQFADIAQWEHQALASGKFRNNLDFWKHKLEYANMNLELPFDHHRPLAPSGKGAIHTLSLSKETIADLRTVSVRTGVSLFTVFLGGLFILLNRWTNSKNMTIGTTVSTRSTDESKNVIGPLINIVPICAEIVKTASVSTFLSQLRGELSEAKAHAELPLDLPLSTPRTAQTPGQPARFQVVLNRPLVRECGDWHASPFEIHTGTAIFDLAVELEDYPDGMRVHFGYNTDVFLESTIKRLAARYKAILQSMAASPEQQIGAISILTDEERNKVLQWGTSTIAACSDDLLHRIFESRVQTSPDSPAIISHDETITYKEANRRANHLARRLREKGVTVETRVAVFLERSPNIVISMLAILKLGAVYLPIDVAQPQARTSFIIEDASPLVIIADPETAHKLGEHNDKLLILQKENESADHESEPNPSTSIHPKNVAYIIYTSGTTGKPKGSAIEHRGLSNLVAANRRVLNIHSQDRILQFASPSFDISIWECCFSFASGAALVIWNPNSALSSASLASYIRQKSVTIAVLPPTVLISLPPEADQMFSGVHTLISGGEACSTQIVERWAPGRTFYNAYGPTEITVCATMVQRTPGQLSVPIGAPMLNTLCYVLDQNGDFTPIGVAGELFIGGQGLARCYLNRPDLTAERFGPDPYASEPGARMYRTGDLVRWTDDGLIEYLGRIDTQIKLRGVRIELGEIERVLERHPLVLSAVAVFIDSSAIGPYIHAFLVRKAGTDGPETSEPAAPINIVRSWLRTQLPEVMVPAAFEFIDALPLTTNGKTDRENLRARARLVRHTNAASHPATEVERAIAAIWEKLLGLSKIDMDESFFNMGGNSLLVIQAQMAIKRELGLDIPTLDFFRYPSVRALSSHLRSERSSTGHDTGIQERAKKQRESVNLQAKRMQSKRNK